MAAIWFPLIETKTGSTTFVETLAAWFASRGVKTHVQRFPHAFQYAPTLLRTVAPPADATAVLTNSWNGFAFHRPGLHSVCVEHLFVLDPALSPYKSAAQKVFHEQFVRRFVRTSYLSADQVVAVSQYTANRVAERFPSIPVQSIPNGIDTAWFSPSQEERNPGQAMRLLFSGTPSTRKGSDLLPAIARGLDRGITISVTAGEPDMPELAEMPNIRFLGRQDPERMPDLYREHDALLMPTRMEGLPLAALEAMACGKPVIASEVGALPELIDAGRTGELITKDDASAFASAANGLASDRERLASMGKAARARIEKQFSLDQMGLAYSQALGINLAP